MHKITKPVYHVDTSSHMTNEKRYISISTRPVTTKLDRMVGYDKKPQTCSKKQVTCSFVYANKKCYMSTSARPSLLNLKWICFMRKDHYPQWSHETIVA